MSCCNFPNRRSGPERGLGPGRGMGPGFNDRRGCCNVNWCSCRGNRLGPGRAPFRSDPHRPR